MTRPEQRYQRSALEPSVASGKRRPTPGQPHLVRREAIAKEPPTVVAPTQQATGKKSPGTYTSHTGSMDEFTVEEDRSRLAPPKTLLSRAKKQTPEVKTVVSLPGRLELIAGPDSGRSVELPIGRTTIGRGLDNNIVLSDLSVSRHHLVIERRGNVYILNPIKSGNGTYVNGREHVGEVLIHHRDVISIGNTQIRLEDPTAPVNEGEEEATTAWAKPEDAHNIRTVLGKNGKRPLAEAAAQDVAVTPQLRKRSSSTQSPLPLAPQTVSRSIQQGVSHPYPRPQTITAPQRVHHGTKQIAYNSPSQPGVGLPAMSPPGFSRPQPLGAQSSSKGLIIRILCGSLAIVAIGIVAAVVNSNEEPASVASSHDAVMVASASNESTAWKVDESAAKADPVQDPVVASPPVGEIQPEVEVIADEETVEEQTVETNDAQNLPTKPDAIEPAKPLPAKSPRRKARPKQQSKQQPSRSTPATPEAKPAKTGPSSSAAVQTARNLYRSQQFDDAIDTLRTAADGMSDDASASRLLELADDYEEVSSLLSDARDKQRTEASSSLRLLKKALTADKKVGQGRLASFIRLQIAEVAPAAAASYMVKGDLEEARKAADDASRYGNPEGVEGVYSSLERKADRLVEKAEQALEDDDESTAQELFEEVLRIAPKNSAAARTARREL